MLDKDMSWIQIHWRRFIPDRQPFFQQIVDGGGVG